MRPLDQSRTAPVVDRAPPRSVVALVRGWSATSGNLATVAHLVSLAGVVAFWALVDRGLWFFGDEWDSWRAGA